MARYGQRPENALKRANEFIEVGKPARALDTLYEVFKNKKWAYNWSESVLEPIMFKYLDLCVELKKSHIAKEGLFQYRNMFQSVNVGSLENVIRGYLKTAEDRTEAAREQSQQAVIDIDDLDNLATPESILLSAVSGEDAQDRSDRTILTPWVKFLWESYCQCLELLRTNAHVETLYHDIARMAYQFCLKYNRKTEFRKLCEKLRKHLEDINKLPVLAANVSLTKPETQQFNLDTRLVQLDCAIQMELWQEAYKATEDIHGLMGLSKKPPVPKTMANYYHKLAMVFWKAGYYLFHAAALFKLFQLSKDMKKNMTHDELQRMACRVLLATLAIPLPSAHPEFDRFIETDKSPMEKAQRLAVLLTLPQPPTRASLLKDIVRLNVVGLATAPLQELYNCLEVEFSPLTLCCQVQGVCDGLVGEESRQYIPPLQEVTLVRLIRQVSQVYQTIQFSRLLELATFTTPFRLERLLVECVRHNDMQIRIEHSTGCVHFGTDLSESQREDHPEGPTLQDMPSEQVRNQLVNMFNVLHRSMQVINPNLHKVERDRQRTQMVQHYVDTKVREHQRILARHKIIEDRKEFLERMNTVREEEEARRAEELARQQALAEHRRQEEERQERERKRHENEIQQIKDRHLKEKMQQISQTAHGQKVLKKLDEEEIKKMDAEQIAAKEAEELQKERKEMQQKLKSQEKKVDYFERAKRLEEIPLMKKSFEEKEIQDRKFWEQLEAERIAAVIAERKLAVGHRERLARMHPDRDVFLEKIKAQRQAAYQEKLKEFEAKMSDERKKRLLERKTKRKEERRSAWIREREEEARRKEEEERRKKEEEERLKKEEEERLEAARKAEEEERYRKEKEQRDKQAEIARLREEEASRKLEEKAKSTGGSWRGGGGSGGGGTKEDDKRPPARGGGFDRGGDRDTRAEDSGGSWRRGGDVKPSDQAWKPKSLSRRDDDQRRPAEDHREDRDRFGQNRERDRDFDRDRRDRPDFGRDRDRDFGRDRDRFRDRDDRDRPGFGRSFDRPADRERPKEASSWRTRDMEADSDSRGPPPRRGADERGLARSPVRRDDRGPGGGRSPVRRDGGRGGGGGGGDKEWRTPKSDAPPPSRAPPPEPKPAPAPVVGQVATDLITGSDVTQPDPDSDPNPNDPCLWAPANNASPAEEEDSSWKKVSRR